jgi:hypothetical protein
LVCTLGVSDSRFKGNEWEKLCKFRRHANPAEAVFRLRRGTAPSRFRLSVRTNDGRRPFMSDYRNQDFDYRSPDDPLRRDAKMDPDARAANAAWGWVAAAVFLVVVLAVAFGLGHQPSNNGTNTASNNVTPPAAIHMTPPPSSVLPPTATPAPATPAPPIAPAPNTPAGSQ